jgi:hypothetical protein
MFFLGSLFIIITLPSPLLTDEEDVPVSLVFLPLTNPGFLSWTLLGRPEPTQPHI